MSNESAPPQSAPITKPAKALSDILITLRDMTNPLNSVRQKILEAAASGATLKQCAHSAGLTVPEFKQLMKWGEEGHPAWNGLFRKYMAATAQVEVEIVESIAQHAVAHASIPHAEMVLKRLNPEEYREDKITGAARGGNAVTVHIKTDFSDVVDAEEAEVVE